MSERVLFIDDDTNLLAGYRRSMRKEFDVHVAEGGEAAIETVRQNEPFAVIVADMYMPGMDGITALKKIRQITPDSVRMMLTGQADLETAMNAVNQGHIFRFLTKPCPHDQLLPTVQAGIRQYRLITAEKELLEKTLNGSLSVLTDILSLVKPKAFGQAGRTRRYVRQVATGMELSIGWQLEVAAMLSQMGCLSLPDSVLEKYLSNHPLDDEEKKLVAAHPILTRKLLLQIPRLRIPAEIIAWQSETVRAEKQDAKVEEDIRVGGEVLRAVLDFDKLLTQGFSAFLAISMMRDAKDKNYLPQAVDALKYIEVQTPKQFEMSLDVHELMEGMIFNQDVHASNGRLLLTRGQQVTATILEHMNKWAENVGIEQPIQMICQSSDGDDEGAPTENTVSTGTTR